MNSARPAQTPAPATAGSLTGAAYRQLVSTSALHAQHVLALADEVAKFVALCDDSGLPQAIETLQAGVDGLQLQPATARSGWLARASGKERDPRSTLAAQCLQFDSERSQVESQAREVLALWEARAGAARRMQVEFVVEVQALDRALVGVAKLLRDAKRAVRKERALADTAVALLELGGQEKRADAIHERLRLFEAVARTAHEAHQFTQDITASRAALAKVLQDDLARHAGRLHERLQRLLAAGPASGGAAAGGDALELAEEGRKNLQMWLTQTSATCMRMQHQEHQAAHTLAKLRERAAAALAAVQK